MGVWDGKFDRECHEHVVLVCDRSRSASDRDAAWKRFLTRVAGPIESWARHSPVLSRWSLATEDDARAVLVGVIARMSQRDFDNLRQYLDRREDDGADAEEASLLESLGRLGGVDHDERRDDRASGMMESATSDDSTPLRGWILRLVRYVAKDHVKQRLGWATVAGTGAASGPSKRDLGTGADRLDAIADRGERPPLTDVVAARRALDDIKSYMATFPDPMRRALELWLEDEPFDAIARALSLASADEARALTRAAQARLRERFRGLWPDLCAPRSQTA